MDGHHGHILIVDDNRINRMLLERAVTAQGHQATTADDGRQALDLLNLAGAGPFDVVLLDILMPEMDGYQLLEIVKQDPVLRHIPVIMISALDELDSVIRCIEMGATDYLTKPFKPALLKARLNASLAEKWLRDLELEYLEQVGLVVGAAEAVEQGQYEPNQLDQVAAREDALGQLARVFLRMAQEVHLREQRLKFQLERLRLDVDEMKKALTEPLSIYMPMDRRQALVEGRELPERSNGAALFADISGFTPLTENLARELGRQQGAEELTRLLNQIYGTLINEVHNYHGSVIGFSGDAITCWLDGDDGLRALACGLAMQQAMRQFEAITTPAGVTVSLGIKVAIVTGPVRRLLAGDPQVQVVEALAGHTLDRLAAAEHQTRRGEVCVEAAIVDLAPQDITVADWRTAGINGERLAIVTASTATTGISPWPDLPAEALSEAQCRPWVLRPIYEWIVTGSAQFLAELRPAVALFIQFDGINYDGDQDAGKKLDAYIIWVQRILQRYEGFVIQLTIGDKGSYLYAAFGAPIAHNDDALRAVYAALELQAPPPELDYIGQINLGLAQGQMWSGAYGSTGRRTYGIIGERTNLAARLMQAAGAGILCDEAVYHAAQGRLIFETLPAISVKGKEEAVQVYRPTGEKKRFTRQSTRFVGRSAERVRLRESLENLLQGAGGIMMLVGEAGIGKSRLLADVSRQAEAMGLLTGRVTGATGSRALPYQAWRELLHLLLDLDSFPGPEEQRRHIMALLERTPQHQAFVSLLDPLLPFSFDEIPEVTDLTGRLREEKQRQLLLDLLGNAIETRPVLLLIENGQELDPDSWALVASLSQQIQSLLVVIASRPLPEPLPPGYSQLQQLSKFRLLLLKSMSADESYLLACEHLGVVSLPNPLAEIVKEAAGNPFVIEELIYLLRDEGAISVAGGRCHLSSGVELDKIVLPTTAQGVIISRIDQLSPSEQMVLKVASVIGNVFSGRLLNQIFPVPSDRPYLDSHLKTLQQLELIEPGKGDASYTFQNALVRETAYNALLFVQRRHLHRQVAEWIETHFAGHLAPQFSTLATHWRFADEPIKAIGYLEQAALYARESGDYQEAESFLKQSLELEARLTVLSQQI